MTHDQSHNFAWNGISFDVPADWNLSGHHTFRGVTTIAMEDDFAVRLQLEWTVPRNDIDLATIRARYAKASTQLTAVAEDSSPVKGTPAGWSAVHYRMADARDLMIAYYLAPDRSVFGFFQFHFPPDAIPRPLPALKMVTASFRVEAATAIPWRFYDVAFALDKDFHLSLSSLRAGSKLLTFEWRLRRLFVWHLSLADIILQKTTLQEWVLKHLNAFKPLRAVRFQASGLGGIQAIRKRRYPFGQYEEIGRQCFHYHAEYHFLPEKNQIAVWVLQYRRPDDLKKVQRSFRELGTRT